tara:strand:+ start:296 stop:1087 length:792 start_codon:yes stop_codon:yes gene_type:complete
MISFDEFSSSVYKFISNNVYSLSVLVGLFFIYLLVTTEEGIANMGAEYPGVFEKGKPTNTVKSEEKIIPDPKPLNQKPTPTMKKESEYLASNKSNDAKHLGDYSLLPPGMIPSNNYRNNSQLLAERGGSGDIQGFVEGGMFQALGDLESGVSNLEKDLDSISKPSSKKIVLKLIYAPWCGWSKKALPDFDKIMSELNNTTKNGVTIIIEKYNSDENKEIVKKYNVRGFPHYVLEVIEGDTVTKTVKVQSRDYQGLKKVIMNNL